MDVIGNPVLCTRDGKIELLKIDDTDSVYSDRFFGEAEDLTCLIEFDAHTRSAHVVLTPKSKDFNCGEVYERMYSSCRIDGIISSAANLVNSIRFYANDQPWKS